MMAPSDDALRLPTLRLVLEPIRMHHAAEMVDVLRSPELYRYLPGDPPTLEGLQALYRIWEGRISPDADELWLNWIARESIGGQAVGHFQAGLKATGEAYVGYTVGLAHQRRGYAFEALTEVFRFLRETLHAGPIQACVDDRNLASIKLVEKLRMEKTGRIEGADYFKGVRSDELVFELATKP